MGLMNSSNPTEWNLAARSRGRAASAVASTIALACALAAVRIHALSMPVASCASCALAIVMIAIATRSARRRIEVRLEGTRVVAGDAGRIIWSVERATIRSVLLRRPGNCAHEVLLVLRGGGALVVPARFGAADGYKFGSQLWSMLQNLRAYDGYRG